ncbi:MAG TPA: protein kinase [Gemmatimonadales bacterium]|nr:protein kinase [Gemmatimonadales bacterium]
MDQAALRQALAGRYDLAEPIGEGGSAVVFRAHDLAADREVALKVLRPELASSVGHERFLKEVRIAARLAHPHIVALYDSGVAAGFLYYTMPYVAGGSLRALLRHAGVLQLGHAASITRQVADAVGYAHLHGVVHRDLKPENILIAGAHAFVVDFGIAKALLLSGGETLTRTGYAVGTPGYMSPEQAAGIKDLDARTDVYGLGCVVYEMLVGEVPGVWITDAALKVGRFTDASAAHRARLDALPGRVEQALTRALALRPVDRWPSAEAFAAALGEASEGPLARYSAAEVRAIVGRAAELEAGRATPEQLFSVGSVERIAAEVDIPLEDVRRAMEELGYAAAPAVPATRPAEPGALSPVAHATVEVDRVGNGEVPAAAFGEMEAAIRQALGPGHATVFDGELTWRSDGTAGTAECTVAVTITPRAGQTRVRLAEWRWRVPGRLVGTGVGVLAGAVVGSVIGWLLSGGNPAVAQLLMLPGLVGGALVFRRAVTIMDSESETARLTALADKLIARAGASAAPAVGSPPRLPPTP